MKTIQLAKDTKENKINVFQSHTNKIGEFKPSDMSMAFDWNGDAIIDFFLDVLTDCNYHTEVKQIRETLNK